MSFLILLSQLLHSSELITVPKWTVWSRLLLVLVKLCLWKTLVDTLTVWRKITLLLTPRLMVRVILRIILFILTMRSINSIWSALLLLTCSGSASCVFRIRIVPVTMVAASRRAICLICLNNLFCVQLVLQVWIICRQNTHLIHGCGNIRVLMRGLTCMIIILVVIITIEGQLIVHLFGTRLLTICQACA